MTSSEPKRARFSTQAQDTESGSVPFNREKFLFRMLAGIFLWQAILFTYGVGACLNMGGLKACPQLGDRYENTVNVMVATTLALLGTTTMLNSQMKKKEDDPAKAKPSKP